MALTCSPFLPICTDKLTPKLRSYIFLSYSPQYKGYYYLNPLTSTVYISHHICFLEINFLHAKNFTSPTSFSLLPLVMFLLPLSLPHSLVQKLLPPLSQNPIPILIGTNVSYKHKCMCQSSNIVCNECKIVNPLRN